MPPLAEERYRIDERLFLAKTGLLTLLCSAAIFALAASFGYTATGGVAFAVGVLVSTALSACAGNNEISTATLCFDILLLAAIGFSLFFYFFL